MEEEEEEGLREYEPWRVLEFYSGIGGMVTPLSTVMSINYILE